MSNEDTEPLPDQARDLSPEQATEEERKRSAEAVPDQATASEQLKKRGRSVRAKRSPEQDMVDAVISDTETEEEDEASDTDFVAVAKGSRKVCQAMTPTNCQTQCCIAYAMKQICMQRTAINKHQACGTTQFLVIAYICATCVMCHMVCLLIQCILIHSFIHELFCSFVC